MFGSFSDAMYYSKLFAYKWNDCFCKHQKAFYDHQVDFTNLNIVENTVEQNGLSKSHRMPFCPEIKTKNIRWVFKIPDRTMLYKVLGGRNNTLTVAVQSPGMEQGHSTVEFVPYKNLVCLYIAYREFKYNNKIDQTSASFLLPPCTGISKWRW